MKGLKCLMATWPFPGFLLGGSLIASAVTGEWGLFVVVLVASILMVVILDWLLNLDSRSRARPATGPEMERLPGRRSGAAARSKPSSNGDRPRIVFNRKMRR